VKILWIKAGPLLPITAGGRIRTWNLLKQLSRWDSITALTYTPSYFETHQEEARRYVDLLSMTFPGPAKYSAGYYLDYVCKLASPKPFGVLKTAVPEVRERIAQLAGNGQFDVVLYDFLSASLNFAAGIPSPQVLFTHNVETLIWKRHFHTARNPLMKLVAGIEYLKLKHYELSFSRNFDHILTVSDVDRDYFARTVDPSRISAIPTGVDLEYFHPGSSPPQSNSLVFSGSMDWLANEDAIVYFVEDILPLVARQIPEVTLTVVGRDPGPVLHRLAEANRRVHLTGTVPDVRPYISKGAVYVVPLRVGGGTRLKIFEAMALGKAVVSTTLGAEGLPLVHGRDALLADTPEEFAAATVRLLRDNDLRDRLGAAARRLVESQYGWPSVAWHCHLVLEQVVAAHSAPACIR
jgi:glycosyltransferase involved in cell wall biosynthesis